MKKFLLPLFFLSAFHVSAVTAKQDDDPCLKKGALNSSAFFLCKADLAKKEELLKRELMGNPDVICKERGFTQDTKEYFKCRMDLLELRDKAAKNLTTKKNISDQPDVLTPKKLEKQVKEKSTNSNSVTESMPVASVNPLIKDILYKDKPLLVISRTGDLGSNWKFEVTIDGVIKEVTYGAGAVFELQPGKNIIKLINPRNVICSGGDSEISVDLGTNQIGVLLIGHERGGFCKKKPYLIFERYSADKILLNRNKDSVSLDESVVINASLASAKGKFITIENEVKRLVGEHINAYQEKIIFDTNDQGQKINIKEIFSIKQKSGSKAEIYFAEYDNGLCEVNFYAYEIESGLFKNLLPSLRSIHAHKCQRVIFDVTGDGGSVLDGIYLGLYIRLSGWDTGYGAPRGFMPVYMRSCLSTCANIFIAGNKRYAYMTTDPLIFLTGGDPKEPLYLLGLHQPSSGKDKDKVCIGDSNHETVSLIREYMNYMLPNVGYNLHAESMAISCKSIDAFPSPHRQGIFTGERSLLPWKLIDGFD